MDVLIVDDSQAVRTSLRALLGCITGVGSVREAATLHAALDGIRCDPPTLLILDLHLPDGRGDVALQTLKQLAPEMRIAVFSLHADNSQQQQCRVQGADWFFDKATQADALLDRLLLEVRHGVSTKSDVIAPNPENTP
ncbi:response regulator [Rhodoferax sp. U11-2br]|uniref:response regulator n=1 Tax=Rhodoferax sp. U11-2br TaxID=2838878 RepID=UPI001BEA4D8E|nr:response regulator transcription factor [Rhodoferax sp. U11-2br]MBT3069044.1 response regulator transcription factor [Rhodoferax sp. U11-2br]